jgi:hypothetical protein
MTQTPQWIWLFCRDGTPLSTVFFRKEFQSDSAALGWLRISCNSQYEIYLNGRRLGSANGYQGTDEYQIWRFIRPGRNVIAVRGAGPGGLLVEGKPFRSEPFFSDDSWKASFVEVKGWKELHFDDSSWNKATAFSPSIACPPLRTLNSDGRKIDPIRSASDLRLVDGDRILFMGAGFLQQEMSQGFVELAITSRQSSKKVSFRYLASPASTVFGQIRSDFHLDQNEYNNFLSQVEGYNPSVIILQYGFVESSLGIDQGDIFIEGYRRLIDELDSTNRRLILATPPLLEQRSAPDTNENRNVVVNAYCDQIQDLAVERSLPFTDLRSLYGDAMKSYTSMPLTTDGTSFTPLGYAVAARFWTPKLGHAVGRLEVRIVAGEPTLRRIEGGVISDLEKTSYGLRFTLLDDCLPQPLLFDIGEAHKLVAQSHSRIFAFEELSQGEYTLLIDGREVARARSDRWPSGVAVVIGPESEQAELLRQKIITKNQIVFRSQHRHCSLNFSTLHQQLGQVESDICELAKPRPHTYELIRVA